MSAKDATMSAKDATMSAKAATMSAKDATKSAKDATMGASKTSSFGIEGLTNIHCSTTLVQTYLLLFIAHFEQ